MARVKVSIPKQFNFSTIISVRISDVNYGGHVGNDAILSIIHEARLQFLKHHEYTEIEFAGAGLIMADVAIEFKNEAFYGDEIIVSVAANDFGRVGFDLCYKLEKKKEDEIVSVAFAKTGMVCFNYTEKKVMAVPEAALAKLNQE